MQDNPHEILEEQVCDVTTLMHLLSWWIEYINLTWRSHDSRSVWWILITWLYTSSYSQMQFYSSSYTAFNALWSFTVSTNTFATSLLYNTRGTKSISRNLPSRVWWRACEQHTPEGAGGEFGPTLRENQQKYGNIVFGVPCGFHTRVPWSCKDYTPDFPIPIW